MNLDKDAHPVDSRNATWSRRMIITGRTQIVQDAEQAKLQLRHTCKIDLADWRDDCVAPASEPSWISTSHHPAIRVRPRPARC